MPPALGSLTELVALFHRLVVGLNDRFISLCRRAARV
jgi:hypothetical protein